MRLIRLHLVVSLLVKATNENFDERKLLRVQTKQNRKKKASKQNKKKAKKEVVQNGGNLSPGFSIDERFITYHISALCMYAEKGINYTDSC